jgi:hypothetical protein
MKTQKRPFVVERKLGRRRLTLQPTSIWGDTDLKALVQKVEADAPHLFEPSNASGLEDAANLPIAQRSETPVSDNVEIGDDEQDAVSTVEAEPDHPLQGDVLSFSAVPARKAGSSGKRASKVVKRREKARIRTSGAGADAAANELSFSTQVQATADDLDALDIENRRLKGLLANHLRQENVQLRAMLERFGR